MKFLMHCRYGLSSRETVAMITASWICAGLISSEENDLVVDHNEAPNSKARWENSF